MTPPERHPEDHLIEKLRGLRYEYRSDMRDCAALEKNLHEKLEAIITAVHIAIKTLGTNPRHAIEEIVENKNDPGKGYTRSQVALPERMSAC